MTDRIEMFGAAMSKEEAIKMANTVVAKKERIKNCTVFDEKIRDRMMSWLVINLGIDTLQSVVWSVKSLQGLVGSLAARELTNVFVATCIEQLEDDMAGFTQEQRAAVLPAVLAALGPLNVTNEDWDTDPECMEILRTSPSPFKDLFYPGEQPLN